MISSRALDPNTPFDPKPALSISDSLLSQVLRRRLIWFRAHSSYSQRLLPLPSTWAPQRRSSQLSNHQLQFNPGSSPSTDQLLRRLDHHLRFSLFRSSPPIPPTPPPTALACAAPPTSPVLSTSNPPSPMVLACPSPRHRPTWPRTALVCTPPRNPLSPAATALARILFCHPPAPPPTALARISPPSLPPTSPHQPPMPGRTRSRTPSSYFRPSFMLSLTTLSVRLRTISALFSNACALPYREKFIILDFKRSWRPP
ncbi:hypothetical protein DFH09DRAFT_555334 [Mycena vulgaris]|nr:hypothetical protein DFH09DRAFT_555334 [Mycena vulgaris]